MKRKGKGSCLWLGRRITKIQFCEIGMGRRRIFPDTSLVQGSPTFFGLFHVEKEKGKGSLTKPQTTLGK
jgi:hypothetical protein